MSKGNGEVMTVTILPNTNVGFGRSAIRAGTSFVGIVYLRPGHIAAAFVLDIVDALRTATADVEPPLIAIAERQQATVRLRVRTTPPW